LKRLNIAAAVLFALMARIEIIQNPIYWTCIILKCMEFWEKHFGLRRSLSK
jgi:hypothetical protein